MQGELVEYAVIQSVNIIVVVSPVLVKPESRCTLIQVNEPALSFFFIVLRFCILDLVHDALHHQLIKSVISGIFLAARLELSHLLRLLAHDFSG